MKFIKTIASLLILIVVSLLGFGVYNCIDGNYMSHNLFNVMFILVFAVVVGYAAFKGMRRLWFVLIIGLGLSVNLTSCSYAKSNQTILTTEDCGKTWSEIKPGEHVPSAGVNPCFMKVSIPNTPMQGDMKFISNMKDKVRITTIIDYDYDIVNGLDFIKEAKTLGKANVSADSDDAVPNDFESAENRVIDKRIRDNVKSILILEDILDYDQVELEEKIKDKSNEALKKYGIQLNFITLTFEPDDQTRQAIDVATAMRIYDSKNLTELGKSVVAQRAGATKISVNTINKQESETE